jgi:hypothetical protein
MKTNIHLRTYLAHFFLEAEIFQTNFVQKIKTHILYSKESSPITVLEWPRGFQEVKVPSFHDNGTGWW